MRKAPHYRVQHQKPSQRGDERQRLRTANPDLRPSNAKPTLGTVTISEISDAEVGLVADRAAQREAERLISRASGYEEILAGPVRPIRTVSVYIAVPADEDEDEAAIPDVMDCLTPERSRLGQ